MFLEGFTDELTRTGTPGFTKVAGGSLLTKTKLLERLLAAGALTGAAGHAAQKAKVGLVGGRGPEGTTGGAATKGLTGGAAAFLALKALGKMGRRGF